MREKGFTVVELMIVMGVFAILLTLSFINFTSLPGRTEASTTAQRLITDLRLQQTRAMSGDTSGGPGESDYGAYFGSNYYVLFKGTVYNAGDTSNFTVNMDDVNLRFTDNLPAGVNHSIVFAKGGGEVKNYASGQDSVSIINGLAGKTTIIKINKYGATY